MRNSVSLSRPVGSLEPYSFKRTTRSSIEVNGQEVFLGQRPPTAVAMSGEATPHFHLPGEPCPLVKEPRR